MGGRHILTLDEKLIKITKTKLTIAIICHLACTGFLSLNIFSIAGGLGGTHLNTVMQGMRWISVFITLYVNFLLIRIYAGPFFECAKHGTTGKGAYLSGVFKDHDDYLESLKNQDGRFEMVYQTANYIIMQEVLKPFTLIVYCSVTIWLIWSFIVAVFYSSNIILLYAGVAALLQTFLFEAAEAQFKKTAYAFLKKEKLI